MAFFNSMVMTDLYGKRHAEMETWMDFQVSFTSTDFSLFRDINLSHSV